MMKARPHYLKAIREAFRTHPVVAILGPRQCGKTTLAHLFVDELEEEVHLFDLEEPTDLALLEQSRTALGTLTGTVVIDEVQRMPDLFPVLRVLADKRRGECRFLILGSASRDLIQQSSETLAGRIAYIELTPFSLEEVHQQEPLWQRGGYPNSYLAERDSDSYYWRQQYIATFLERDIPSLGIRIAPAALRRFWLMLTHYHGQMFNASEIGRSLGVADTTVRHYLDVLSGTFMIRQLMPWHENLGKRQVRRSKIYFRDSGIYHALSGITDPQALLHNPKLGASWEGFALEETIRSLRASQEECYFWGVHGEGELDLLVLKDGKRLGFEFKYADAPRLSRSMQLALDLLQLDSLQVVYPGERTYSLASNVTVRPISSMQT